MSSTYKVAGKWHCHTLLVEVWVHMTSLESNMIAIKIKNIPFNVAVSFLGSIP